MAIVPLRRWAAGAAVPAFVARGGGAGLRPLELAGESQLRLVPSPRQASVLLAAGRFPGRLGHALNRVHDQMPAPRGVVWWTADPLAERPSALERAVVVGADDDVAGAVVAAHRQAVYGAHDEPDTQPDDPPNPFEGRGDHGQGGEGMMGGVPYGRPMPMTGDDRDGLALDQLRVELGPFLVGLPGGTVVRAVLQGGIVQEASLEALDPGAGPDLDDLEPANGDDVVRHELRWLAEALRLGGLPALAARAAHLAGQPTARGRRGLARAVRRSGMHSGWAGVGLVDGRDAAARLEARLDGHDAVDSAVAAGLSAEQVGGLLTGQDWADALVAICSLDLDGGRLAARMRS